MTQLRTVTPAWGIDEAKGDDEMKKPKPKTYFDYKPLWAHTVDEWGFEGERREGYVAGIRAAIEYVKLDGQVTCVTRDCGRPELVVPSKKRCEDCPMKDADHTIKTLLELCGADR